jgi:hypothetical protein
MNLALPVLMQYLVNYDTAKGHVDPSSRKQRKRTETPHTCDNIVAAACCSPMPDCSSLVIEYRAASNIRPGTPKIGSSRVLVAEYRLQWPSVN